jgi:hypothetical protein
MRKIINKIVLVILLVSMFNSCSNDPDNAIYNVFDGVEHGAIIRTLERGNQNFNLFDLSSTWSITVETQDEEFGALLSQMVVYVGYVDNKDDGADNNRAEVVLKTITASEFTTSANGLPSTDLSYTLNDMVSALGLSAGQYNGGDLFAIRLELLLTDGRSFSAADGSGSLQGSYFQSPYVYQAGMLCIPATPFTGVYTVDMQDSWGDGWQTATSSGGGGITVTLDDGTVLEVGLCSPYEVNNYPCVNDGSVGTSTVTIPAGTLSADWFFPGDFYGEISFQIFAPSGNLIASYDAGSAAGPIALNLCDE